MTRIGREQILAMIPHQGAMCLLDEVLVWDASSVRCLSYRYCHADNPMRRRDGTLGAAGCVEMAAQAMAVHGRLQAPEDSRAVPGYLVSLRDVCLSAARVDEAAAPLTIDARLLAGDRAGATYHFAVSDKRTEWLSGRATVLFGVRR